MNDYNCPDNIYKVLCKRPYVGPTFQAVNILGPSRVQWIGGKVPGKTTWSLDGIPASESDIYKAAGIDRLNCIRFG